MLRLEIPLVPSGCMSVSTSPPLLGSGLPLKVQAPREDLETSNPAPLPTPPVLRRPTRARAPLAVGAPTWPPLSPRLWKWPQEMVSKWTTWQLAAPSEWPTRTDRTGAVELRSLTPFWTSVIDLVNCYQAPRVVGEAHLTSAKREAIHEAKKRKE